MSEPSLFDMWREVKTPGNTTGKGPDSKPLTLRRVWMRSADHALLEFDDGTGPVPGQWWSDEKRLEKVAAETTHAAPDAGVVIVPAGSTRIVLQPRGADRRLDALAELVATGAVLVRHRPERRAVVRATGPDGVIRYGKVARKDDLQTIASHARLPGAWTSRPFETPRVLDVDEDRNIVWMSEVAGPTWFEQLNVHPDAIASRVGRLLRWLHRRRVDAPLDHHDALDEAAMLQKRLKLLATVLPEAASALDQWLVPVCATLMTDPGPAKAVLHRDAYDKQFIVRDRDLGLLDFDTTARGEPALDVANVLGHLELRAAQGFLTGEAAADAAAAMLEVYDADRETTRRLAAYLDATRLRLACLYALRPEWTHLSAIMAHRIGAPVDRHAVKQDLG